MPKGIYKRTKPAWNKNLTKEINPRVAANGAAISTALKSKPNPKLSIVLTGKKYLMKCTKYPKKSVARKGKSRPDMVGNKNAYIDGRSKLPYDQDWTPSFRESIRVRDNYTCQLCGKTETQEKEDLGCKLSVHHCLYGKVTKDDIFITLCHSCNGGINKKSEKDYWTKFFVARMILTA